MLFYFQTTQLEWNLIVSILGDMVQNSEFPVSHFTLTFGKSHLTIQYYCLESPGTLSFGLLTVGLQSFLKNIKFEKYSSFVDIVLHNYNTKKSNTYSVSSKVVHLIFTLFYTLTLQSLSKIYCSNQINFWQKLKKNI